MESVEHVNKVNEVKRVKLVNLIFLFYWAIIFEGAIRKWVFPEFANYLYFMRDPVVFLIYAFALRNNLLPRISTAYLAGLFLAISSTIFTFFQYFSLDVPWYILGGGWRNHFFLIPLAFIIEKNFQRDDFVRLFKQTLKLTPFILVIAYFQSTSPRDAWINSGSGTDEGIFFLPHGVAQEITRTQGLFTSSVGHMIFVGSLFSSIFVAYTSGIYKKVFSGYEWWIYFFSTLGILGLCGQRGTFILIIIIFFGALFSAFFLPKVRFNSIFKIAGLMVLFSLILFPTFFKAQTDALLFRVRGASVGSSRPDIIGFDLVERIIGGATYFVAQLPTTPLMGYGLGIGSNAATLMKIRTVELSIEDEWSRHIAEMGPIFGFIFILSRFALCIYLVFLSFRHLLKKHDPTPFIILLGIFPFVFHSQMTGHGTGSGYCWFTIGLVLASVNFRMDEDTKQ